MARGLPVSPAAIRRLLSEIESSGGGEHVLAVGGASELAPVLRQQFLRGRADPAAVRVGGPEGSDVYVHVLAGEPSEQDAAVLRRATRARVPVIAVAVGPAGDGGAIPYVLATDVVGARGGGRFPLGAIAHAIAVRLGENGAPLAARVPLLREAVCEQLVASLARKNGWLAVWIRAGSAGGRATGARPKEQAAKGGRGGADLPVLTLNELRLVLRLAQAYGVDDTRRRLPELAATLGAGFGLRALARELLAIFPLRRRPSRRLRSLVGSVEPTPTAPVAGWMVKGAVAYGGTRALGEAARHRFAPAATPPPPAVAGPAAP